ncbi:hypothetical protein H920_02497 [Fukomys damarensis]|uniref:Uncharacterized protein n=1 Tax=Fukomys damarensis TaxID=885580 RepID=A0A091E0A2_FUKDA|nr:hypothetical protein H920_02497 [Fukomys damarensis]
MGLETSLRAAGPWELRDTGAGDSEFTASASLFAGRNRGGLYLADTLLGPERAAASCLTSASRGLRKQHRSVLLLRPKCAQTWDAPLRLVIHVGGIVLESEPHFMYLIEENLLKTVLPRYLSLWKFKYREASESSLMREEIMTTFDKRKQGWWEEAWVRWERLRAVTQERRKASPQVGDGE